MAEIKVSQLPEATDTNSNDTYLVVQDGLTKKIVFANILSKLKSTGEIVVTLAGQPFKVLTASVNSIIVNGTGKVGLNTTSGPHADSNIHLCGVIKIGSSTTDNTITDNGIILHASEILNNDSGISNVPVTTAKRYTEIFVSGADDRTYSLGAGLRGQEKTIICTSRGAGAVKLIANTANFVTQVPFYYFGINSIMNLYCLENGKWIVTSSVGVTTT